MNDPIAIFPNETYLNGLLNADSTVVDAVYNEFRPPIVRAIQDAGGSYADGATFFRVAVIQTSELLNAGKYDYNWPIYPFLSQLAQAQYHGWRKEKGLETVFTQEQIDSSEPILDGIPNEEELAALRLQIQAKRQFYKLETQDQKQILALAIALKDANTSETGPDIKAFTSSINTFKSNLKVKDEIWENGMPAWVVFPLTDPHFNQIWSACEAMERRLNSSQIPSTGANKTILYAFIFFVFLTIGYGAYTWFSRDQSPAEVYDNNFQPPSSIVEDMELRYSKDSIAPNRPEACRIAFAEADKHYKKREWSETAIELSAMLDDSLSVCQSDALFYLAIVGLELDNPELSLECISKIEDLERYGEELYWYMALSYVKIAALDPSKKDKARRAVQRALSNTEIPERRVQAEKMLEELSLDAPQKSQ